MITVNEYCRREFSEKLYKISLDGGFTCPNRDGTRGTRGCIFCSAGGSGDFSADRRKPIPLQIEEAKERIRKKFSGEHFIAYFQAFTNTYGTVERLRELYEPVAEREDISVISIATRPDCLSPDILSFLSELREKKPLWVELGLQTVKPESITYIRRGYENEVYRNAVRELRARDIHVITHVILGLPGETEGDMLSTVQYAVDAGSHGIKLQLLHVLRGTDLCADYLAGKFQVLSLPEYTDIVKKCLQILPDDMVVHRITGDGPKKILEAPLWSADKKRVMNYMKREIGLS